MFLNIQKIAYYTLQNSIEENKNKFYWIQNVYYIANNK